MKRGMVVACRFFFYHIVEFACGAVQKTIKRIRRRGKKLVEAPYVACTNDRNEFGVDDGRRAKLLPVQY